MEIVFSADVERCTCSDGGVVEKDDAGVFALVCVDAKELEDVNCRVFFSDFLEDWEDGDNVDAVPGIQSVWLANGGGGGIKRVFILSCWEADEAAFDPGAYESDFLLMDINAVNGDGSDSDKGPRSDDDGMDVFVVDAVSVSIDIVDVSDRLEEGRPY